MSSDPWETPGPLDDLLLEYGERALPAVRRWVERHLEVVSWARRLGPWRTNTSTWSREHIETASNVHGKEVICQVNRYFSSVDIQRGRRGTARWWVAVAYSGVPGREFLRLKDALAAADELARSLGWVFDPSLPSNLEDAEFAPAELPGAPRPPTPANTDFCETCAGEGSYADPDTGEVTSCTVCDGTGRGLCRQCDGDGWDNNLGFTSTCRACQGTGRSR